MGNEVALHLSGGVFFNLMLAARKKPVANQNQCLKELLYIYDRSAKEMAGNSLVTIASRFRNCDPDLHSDYIRFGDPVVVEEFNGRMRENYASVVGEVKNYADQYLDLEVNGKWLVRALMELVEKDNLIQYKSRRHDSQEKQRDHNTRITAGKMIFFHQERKIEADDDH